MSYGIMQLEELASKLRRIREALSYELPDFWWLSQGEEALVSVRMLRKNGRLDIYETPRLSIKAAIRTIIENIELAKRLKGEEFYRAMRIIEEDVSRVVEVYSMVKEAHEIVRKIEHLKRMLAGKEIHKTKKDELNSVLDGTIRWIREIFSTNPAEWRKRKDMFEKVVERAEREIAEAG